MDLKKTIKVHFIDESNNDVLAKFLISFPPGVGDTIRLEEDNYWTVTQVVWVYDEPDTPYSRLNIGLIKG